MDQISLDDQLNEDSESASTCSDEDSSNEETELEQTCIKGNAFYNSCVEVYNKPLYEDVTAMINSTVPTLIDGDALLMYAVLQGSHPITLGNQFLHVAYIYERFIDALLQKGANCILIFFDLWEVAWEKNLPLRTLRRAMYHHFKSNTTIRTCRFKWYYSSTFSDFKKEEKPRGILSNLNFNCSIDEFNEKWQNGNFCLNCEHALKLFASSLVYCIATDLPIIDINHVTVGVTLIHSFSISAKPVKLNIYAKLWDDLLNDISPYDTVIPKKISMSRENIKTTRDLVLEAGIQYLENFQNTSELKCLLFYYAVKLTLPMENRAPPKIEIDKELLGILHDIANRWHNCLYVILYNIDISKIDFDFQYIADLWQGTLFVCILSLISNSIQDHTELGPLHIEYEGLISDLNSRLCGQIDIKPYPIDTIIPCNTNFYREEEKSADVLEMVKLSKIDNPLIEKFCENIFDEVFWKNPTEVFTMNQFGETRHWHYRKSIEDGFQNKNRSVEIHSSRHADRQYQKAFRYTSIYGENLEGKVTQYDAIIYQDPKRSKSVPKKQSKSSMLMQQKIQTDKNRIALEKDQKELRKFKEGMNTAGNIKQLKNDLHSITNIINRLSCPEMVVKGNVLKLKILKAIVSSENDENKIDGIKNIFLVIRKILKMEDGKSTSVEINEKDQKLISKLLHLYGFSEIRQRNNLPIDKAFKEEYHYNWVRFQLEHLGADLLQESGNSFDADVNFAPDKWQAEFINAIRRNESALVVAPTSSGKTFACYYCMKRVLQYSLDGIVVYVAPTKALVSQVAATVTHRFKNAKLPEDGKSLVGVFTRDYRHNPTTSRILITVPQCLDILLLSPIQYNWNSKIKYVIFDEVHRLSGNEEGLVWERLLLMIRCPFLALSATISDANLFYQWLQNMETFKEEEDKKINCLRESYKVRCIVHEERHADLKKHVYSSGSLEHYHPYCSLHSRILLDRGKIPESITLSPKETMQLYDVLSNFAEEYIPAELNYLDFFNGRTETGFITRKSVREYEKELGKIFYKIYEEDFERYKEILHNLNPSGYENLNTGRTSLAEGYALLHHMADNNMLPAIVFSYNRTLVEAFCEELLPEIESTANNMSRKQNRAEKLTRKLKLASKDKRRKRADRFDDEDGASSLCADSPDAKENPMNILANTTSKFKGIGVVDRDDLRFIEKRLYIQYLQHVDANFRKLIIAQFQSGLAYHHAGVNKKLRDTTEMLFRIGIVKVVVATGTLALGVHMPCKSVVIFGDSPFLNSLEFHQMSGRAGRRGFDNEGNVIFLNLTKKRHDMLMTDKLPKMLGNFPVNIALVARLLLLLAGSTENKKVSSDEYLKISLSKALTLLENSLLFQTKPHLKQQIKYFVGFALQLLFIQQIIDAKGIPTLWCSFVIHLHYHEPANLAFTYLVRCGALENLVKITDDDNDLQWKLVVVLCHLFTKIPLTEKHAKDKLHNSVVKLDPLPTSIKEALHRYNKEIKFVFNQYFLSIARHLRPTLGADNTLPLSNVEFKVKKYYLLEDGTETIMHRIRAMCYQREITSAFVALSCNEDTKLKPHRLISNIRSEIAPEINIVPKIQTSLNLNGYALDFYRHGSRLAINRDNRLRQGQDFIQLNDFRLAINAITLALEDLGLEGIANKRLVANFKCVQQKYNSLFENAYYFAK